MAISATIEDRPNKIEKRDPITMVIYISIVSTCFGGYCAMPFSVGIIIGTINTIHNLSVYAHGPAKRDRNLMNQ